MGQNHPRKLTLSRETVRDLTKDALGGIGGGDNKPYTARCTNQTTAQTIYPCLRCCVAIISEAEC